MATNRYVALNSWSAFTLNLPFSKIAIVVGDPIGVPEGAGSIELEATRLSVEQGLNEVTQRAYGLAGGKDHSPFLHSLEKAQVTRRRDGPRQGQLPRPGLGALEGDEHLIVLRPRAHGDGEGNLLDHGEIADRIFRGDDGRDVGLVFRQHPAGRRRPP